MSELHLIVEAKLSEIAGKGVGTDPPCDLWAFAGSLPDGIEVDEPRPLVFTDPRTRQPVRQDAHLLHDLSYEDFCKLRATAQLTKVATNLKLIPQAIPALLTAKAVALSLDCDVFLYETCDY